MSVFPGGKRPGRMLMDDKKVHRELQSAATSLRDASEALRATKAKPKRSMLRRVIVVGMVGTGIAAIASEGFRKKILDGLFGAEEEFEYTSTTTPAARRLERRQRCTGRVRRSRREVLTADPGRRCGRPGAVLRRTGWPAS